MRDIRRLERETQLILQKKLGRVPENQELEEEEEEEEVKGGEGGGEGGEKEMEEKKGKVEETNHEDQPISLPHHSVPGHASSSSPPVVMHRSASDVQSTTQTHELNRSTLHPSALPIVRKGSLPTGKKRDNKRDRSNTQGSLRSMYHKRSEGLLPMSRSHSKVEGDSDGESMYSARPEWALDSIAISDTDSELEYFDAIGERGRFLLLSP